jgi:D-alanyl-D-alanine carboxypeptidase
MATNVQARLRACGVSTGVFSLLIVTFVTLAAALTPARAAEYAALVMDARNGKVLHASNADARLHPASLTKMMTLYVAFEAIENGEITLDTLVSVSRNASSEPPSKLGLKTGQKIKLRYLIRAAAVKSANDAATAIGEAIEGSEAAFARRMNRTAKALGMSRTTFKNANGLTEAGHLSTARDMSVLGRHVFYDYPDYYNLFSRKTADAGVRTVAHTNTRFLNSYAGADGIKTGYTSAAGFNLTASARRGQERIITTVFGGRSTTTRNARVTELMDLGFKRASTNVAVNKPKRPPYMGKAGTAAVLVAGNDRTPHTAAKIVRSSIIIKSSPVPNIRPLRSGLAPIDETRLLAISNELQEAVLQSAEQTAALTEASAVAAPTLLTTTEISNTAPVLRPKRLALASIETTSAAIAAPTAQTPPPTTAPEVVTRISTSGNRHWGINIGTYGSEYEARKVLLKTALAELETLDGALRKVVHVSQGYNANFLGLTEDVASLTCRKLEARGGTCSTLGPS